MGERRRAPCTRAVLALLVHAGSSFLCAIEGVWFTADLWFVRELVPSEDIPMAAGAVGPPSVLSITAMVLSVVSTLYTAGVLALWARAEAREKRENGRDRQPYLIGAVWVAAIAISTLPTAFVPGDVLESVLTAFRVSYSEAATSICMLVVDLGLASAATSRIRRLREQPGV